MSRSRKKEDRCTCEERQRGQSIRTKPGFRRRASARHRDAGNRQELPRKQGSPGHQKLVRKLREVYALLVNERQKNNDMLRETAYWKRKAEPNELMQEKVSKLDRLTRTLGSDEIDRLLSQRSTHEHSRYKAWETNR